MSALVTARTERALLCSLLSDPGATEEVEGVITPAMFGATDHEAIYRSVLRVRKAKREVNLITVPEDMDRHGQSAFVSVAFEIASSLAHASVADLVTELRLAHQRREIVAACTALVSRGQDATIDHRDFVADAESRITSITAQSRGGNEGLRKLDPGTAYRAIEETIRNKGRINQTTTLRELDAITNGLGNGHVFAIGGYPGDGKTGLAIQILENVAVKRGRPAAFFSLEMPEDDIAKRLLSRGSGVKLHNMRNGHLTHDQIAAMDGPLDQLKIAPIFIYDKPEPTIGTIRAEARRLKARVGDIGVIVIDYVQLVRGTMRTDNREQEVAEVARGVKALAKEIGCPVVELAQLNSDGMKRPNSRPRAGDVRESKQIWADADVFALIWNPNKDKIDAGKMSDDGERRIIIDKNRHGPRGEAKCRFDTNTATFLDEDADLPAWPTTTKGTTPDYAGGRPDDSDGDGEPWDDDQRWPS